jgi:hypothetical protein
VIFGQECNIKEWRIKLKIFVISEVKFKFETIIQICIQIGIKLWLYVF